MYKRAGAQWIKNMNFMTVDCLCLICSFCVAYFIRFKGVLWPLHRGIYLTLLLIMIAFQIIAAFILDNYKEINQRGSLIELEKVALHALFMTGLMTILLFAFKISVTYSRIMVFLTILIYVVVDWACRVAYKKYLRYRLSHSNESEKNGRSIIIVTDSSKAEKIISDIRSDTVNSFNIRGLVLVDQETSAGGAIKEIDNVPVVNPIKEIDNVPVGGPIKEIDNVPVVSTLSGAAEFICHEWIDEVCIFLGYEPEGISEFYSHCAEMGVVTHSVLIVEAVNEQKQFVEKLGEHTVLTTAYNFVSPQEVFVKRLMDIVGGLIGSALAIVILIVIGPIIYISSPGPIIFKQQRLGRNGKPFYVLKLRSMYPDAEARKQELLSDNRVSDGMMFKLEHDPRVIGNRQREDGSWRTGIGEFIRRTSLDEFPQFFNVLKGEMSLVGTRPPTIDEWEKYEYHHRARLAIKPGITGLWQISGRSEITDFEEVVRLDTKYITNYRISLDLKILFKTILVLFKRKGAM